MASTTPTDGQSLRKRVERILKQFAASPELPDYNLFVSGINSGDDLGAIDDGNYGDPMKSKKPDFIRDELNGWQ